MRASARSAQAAPATRGLDRARPEAAAARRAGWRRRWSGRSRRRWTAGRSSSRSCRPTRRSGSARPPSCAELAQSEYELQARLREAGEALTQEEVRVAQIRDRESATARRARGISQQLGATHRHRRAAAHKEERIEVEARLERLERRRERIGPVNPLAESEYKEAVEHVEELERQRKDLEAALAELESLIRETDRRIRESFEETFEITARNFEEVIQHLFPGGRGKLRLVKPPRPRVVLGGAEPDEPADEQAPQRPRRARSRGGDMAGDRADESARDARASRSR